MKNELFTYSYTGAGLTDIGLQRGSNQDEVALAPELGLFAVSDGMGGLRESALASAFVKDKFPKLMAYSREDWQPGDSLESVKDALELNACVCSDYLFEKYNSRRYSTCGATLAAVQLYGNRAVFVCLGDSRGYILREDSSLPEQITEDMNLAGKLYRAGRLTKEQTLNSPLRSQLTAFVGMSPPATPAVYVTGLQPGDRILLCSDGLYSMVPERELADILRSDGSPEEICRELIERANANGGADNIAAVYVKIGDAD